MNRLLSNILISAIFAISSPGLAQDSLKSYKTISRVKNNITVSVSPQVELISIVQTISKYPTVLGFLMTKDSSDYKTDVIDHFQEFNDHPAVRMFDRLSLQPRMLNYSAPSNIMLYTDESLKLRTDIELDDFVVSRAGGIDSLNEFLNLLGDFAIQSSFQEFFQAHGDFYLKIVENTISNLGLTDYISEVETFYGKKQKSYHMILVSLYGGNGFGNSLLCSNNQREIYNTMGPMTVKDNMPFFGDEAYFKYMIRHEFSHPFINPLTEKNWDYVKEYSYKYDSIPEVARNKVCGDWQDCINEFIIRAITTHLAFNETEESGLQAYEKEKSKGVSDLDNLLNKIRFYQSNRESYSTFESYYLHILDVFREE